MGQIRQIFLLVKKSQFFVKAIDSNHLLIQPSHPKSIHIGHIPKKNDICTSKHGIELLQPARGVFRTPNCGSLKLMQMYQTSKAIEFLSFPNRINVWYIYLNLVVFYGKFRYTVYHTLILSVQIFQPENGITPLKFSKKAPENGRKRIFPLNH